MINDVENSDFIENHRYFRKSTESGKWPGFGGLGRPNSGFGQKLGFSRAKSENPSRGPNRLFLPKKIYDFRRLKGSEFHFSEKKGPGPPVGISHFVPAISGL